MKETYDTYEQRVIDRALEFLKENEDGYYYLDTTDMTLHLDELALSILMEFMDKLNGMVYERELIQNIETTTEEDVQRIQEQIDEALEGNMITEEDEFIDSILTELTQEAQRMGAYGNNEEE